MNCSFSSTWAVADAFFSCYKDWMTTKFPTFLVASCLALSCSAFAAGPMVPVQAPAAPQMATPSAGAFLSDLKGKLKINGTAQENAWTNFVKGSERTIDMSTFQDMARAKTTPELMNGLEKMQSQAAGRFAEQKKVIIGLYDVLDLEQRKAFDVFVFSTMAKMGAPGAPR